MEKDGTPNGPLHHPALEIGDSLALSVLAHGMRGHEDSQTHEHIACAEENFEMN